MNLSSKILLEWLKPYRLVTVLILLGAAMLVLNQFSLGKKWLSPLYDSSFRLSAEIPDGRLMLRWNALVNPWRHPARELTFQTELKLPLLLRNTGGRIAEIEAMRLLSSWQDGHIIWEGLWLAEDRAWDRATPIEAQIRQHRHRLTSIPVEPHASPRQQIVDFVPVDHPLPLAKAAYRNLLQVKVTGTDGWLNLLQFSFSIADDFELQDSRGYRYQHWQPFAVAPRNPESPESR